MCEDVDGIQFLKPTLKVLQTLRRKVIKKSMQQISCTFKDLEGNWPEDYDKYSKDDVFESLAPGLLFC